MFCIYAPQFSDNIVTFKDKKKEIYIFKLSGHFAHKCKISGEVFAKCHVD